MHPRSPWTAVWFIVSCVLAVFLGLSWTGTFPGSPSTATTTSGHSQPRIMTGPIGMGPQKIVRPSGPVFMSASKGSDLYGNPVDLHKCGPNYVPIDVSVGSTVNQDGSMFAATQSTDGYAQTDVNVSLKAGPHLLIAGMIVRAVADVGNAEYSGTESDTVLPENIQPGGHASFDLKTKAYTAVYQDIISRVTLCVAGVTGQPHGPMYTVESSGTDLYGNPVVLHACGLHYQSVDLPIGHSVNQDGAAFEAKEVNDGYAQTGVNVSITSGPYHVTGMIVRAVADVGNSEYSGTESDTPLGLDIQPHGHGTFDLPTEAYTADYQDSIPRVTLCLAA